MATRTNQSADKIFTVLDVLFRNFVTGYTPSELAKATGLTPTNITRAVLTLEKAGYAERIHDTGRIRVSVAVARKAIQVAQNVETAENRISELKTRLFTNV